jgi:hypothetical protein
MSTDLGDILSGKGADAPEPVKTEQVSQPAANAAPEPSQAPEAVSEAAQEGDQPAGDNGMVPVAALQAERQKAKRYTEQVAEFQKKLDQQQAMIQQMLVAQQRPAPQPEPQAPPDFFADPDAYLDSRLQPLQQQFEQQRLAQSEMLAVEKFGNEAVADAFQAFQQYAQTDPASQIEHRRIMSSPHPFGELVKWRERHKALSEIGSDPVGFRAKLEEEIRQKVLAELQPTQTQAPAQTAPVMPSNFAGARNVGNRSTGPAWSGPTPINDIFARK